MELMPSVLTMYQPGFSLSLGISCCMQCSTSWRDYLSLIVLAAIITGVLLIAIILILKLTVAVGNAKRIDFLCQYH